jgi:drug/metabolite transporter (DMT)-like permease
MNQARGPLLGGAAAIVGAFAYGVNIPTARMAGQVGMSGASQAMLRGVIFAFILASLIVILRRGFRITGGETKRIIVMGLLSGAIGTCYLSAVTFVPVAIGVTIFYTFPLLLILAAPVFGTGQITLSRMAAFVIAFTGIIIAVGPGLSGLDWRGIVLAFAASVACAALFQLTPTVKQDRVRLLFWMQTTALCVIVPATALTGWFAPAALEAAWLPVMVSALGFYVGFACQIIAGSRLRPATAGLLFLLEPVVAILAAQWLLGEVLAPLQYAGITLVIAGLALDTLMQNRQSQAA